jgi:hypothetical protein
MKAAILTHFLRNLTITAVLTTVFISGITAQNMPEQDTVQHADTLHEITYQPEKVESTSTSQDAWLIDSGYYKSTRTPVWHRVKSIFTAKQSDEEFAEQDVR